MKFFQKLRREIVGKNQTRKYLKYATGEIILVVIGILIALSINNWNENRRKEAVVIETLKEIHRDLSGDIIESNYLISRYSKEDSLIYVLLTKELSKEDSGEHQWLTFASVAHSYTDLKLNDNGYKMLMENSDNIPMKYQPLLSSLNQIYVNDKTILDQTFKIAVDELADYLSFLVETKDWYSEFIYFSRITPKAVDFFMNDPYYKNHLSSFHLNFIKNYYISLYTFRKHAEACYEELTKILELEDLIARDSNYYNIDVADYEHLLGTYRDSIIKVVISTESEKLFYQWDNTSKVRLYPISKGSFIHGFDYSFNSIQRDSSGQVISHDWHFGKLQGVLKKVD